MYKQAGKMTYEAASIMSLAVSVLEEKLLHILFPHITLQNILIRCQLQYAVHV